MEWITTAGLATVGALAIAAFFFAITFALEREVRPALVTLVAFAVAAAPLSLLVAADFEGGDLALAVLLGAGVLSAAAMALVKTRRAPLERIGGATRVDERDAVFHRFYTLEEGSADFEAYYAENPDKADFDAKVRRLPGLSSPDARTYHPATTPFQEAAFDVCERMTREIDWAPEPLGDAPVPISPREAAARIKGFASHMGAAAVGCTALDPAHVYSNIGRSPGVWGAPIDLDHSHAIAIAVPMSHAMVRLAPDSPTTTETAFEYLEAARIAMVLARYVNLLGYEARAHVDGNYRVMCVPVAADAGLGELGRNGLLIHPTMGPRIRISVVTTNLPLAQDPPAVFGVQDFCQVCRKCADICPSGSVDGGDKREINGAVKWQTRRDTCYRYWRTIGSDCALCVKICPYAHPTNPAHNAVRWLIGRNGLARRIALKADDLAYGRKPATSYPCPPWHSRG